VRLAAFPGETKNRAIAAIARALEDNADQIAKANRADLQRAEKENLSLPLLKRLRFDQDKINEAVSGLTSLIGLADPVGVTLRATELDQGLELYKVTCPIGVIGVIFESRPDALVQISSLCLKSGNAVLLKGGSEAVETNRALAGLISASAEKEGIPPGWLALLETRADVAEMLGMDAFIDLIVPRGSNAFVRHIMENTKIPVLGHADGICHLYVDRAADLEQALRLAIDSKTQYPAACNAIETLLVHDQVAAPFLERAIPAFHGAGVELRGDEASRAMGIARRATEEDWRTEYSDLILSVKVVETMEEALAHIARYGSRHTDAICTTDPAAADHFLAAVDSAGVFLNCSTRFADGNRYGFGAEVGISTQTLPPRGPVGVEGLVTYRYRLRGDGHIAADYASGQRSFTHRTLPL
jgi:glutamate-5-semialdehyde dehydrogenase